MAGEDTMNEDLLNESRIAKLTLNDDSNSSTDQFYGHRFNYDWKLVDLEGKPFKFDVYEDPAKNNERYNKIGEKITEYIYDLMCSKYNMEKVFIPLRSEGPAFIFVTKGSLEGALKASENDEKAPKSSVNKGERKVMLLIHGSGVVRGGQWARRIIMNNDLMQGSQLSFISEAHLQGYDVVVYNGNHVTDAEGKPIKDLDTPLKHGDHVWQHIVSQMEGRVYIVAHSYGGKVALHMAQNHEESFTRKVAAVAFTDSYALDALASKPEKQELVSFFKQNSVEWVASDLGLDQQVPGNIAFKRLSAGHPRHEWSTPSCMTSIFSYFKQHHNSSTAPKETSDSNVSDNVKQNEKSPSNQDKEL